MSATTPTTGTCPRCDATIIQVRYDHQLGHLIGNPRLDPTALNPHQILAAIITGTPLWIIHTHAGHPVTSSLRNWWPAKPKPGTTIPEHHCHHTWNAPTITITTTTPEPPQQPPF